MQGGIAMDLFDQTGAESLEKDAPLAARMRPRSLDEFVGQEDIMGSGKMLRRSIETDTVSSLLFWGPPGTGKTTLARLIAASTKSYFASVSAVTAGVADLRQVIAEAKERRKLRSQRTTVLVDEIHRFNKAQQDALLPHVEDGTIVFIGCTTENPFFSVIPALVSRSRIYHFNPLSEHDLSELIDRALADPERGFGRLTVLLDDDARQHLITITGGDARIALNALEAAVAASPTDAEGRIHITRSLAEEAVQKRAILYDKTGDEHYDTISAFIKSMRGSDPDAAVYWMAKMIYAGEDPRFIARRMMIFAAEDVGLADPQALVVAVGAAQALEMLGMPEAQFPLAEACLYLATAPKSNSAFAYFRALKEVEARGRAIVPLHLRNKVPPGVKPGAQYKYPHDFPYHHVAQQYLPDALAGTTFFTPGELGFEKTVAERVKWWRARARGGEGEKG
jgi:putative ATPase